MIEDLMPLPQPDPLTLELTTDSSAASIGARSVSKIRDNETDPTTSVPEPETRPITRDREASMASDSSASTNSAASVHESRRPDRLPLGRQTEKRRWPLGLLLASIGVRSMSTDNDADSIVSVRESETRPIALGKRKREAFMATTFLGSWIGVKMKKWRKNESLVHREIGSYGYDIAPNPIEEKDSDCYEITMMAQEIYSPSRRSGLWRDQVQLVKKKDSDRYEIAPIEETLSFEKRVFCCHPSMPNIGPKEYRTGINWSSRSFWSCRAFFTEKGLNFEPEIAVISMDNYDDASQIIDGNFDDPSLTDYATLLDNIQGLKAGKAVQIPIYDFKASSRIGYMF